MKKIRYLFLSILLLLVGFFSFKVSIPFFEIKKSITFKKVLIDNEVNFNLGGVYVSKVASNSPASRGGIKPHSQIILINKESVNNTVEFIKVINTNLGKSVQIDVCESNNCRSINVVPREQPSETQGPLGIVIHNISKYDRTTFGLIYDEIYKRFTGKDFFSAFFGNRVLIQSWFTLILGIFTTILSTILIVRILKKKYS